MNISAKEKKQSFVGKKILLFLITINFFVMGFAIQDANTSMRSKFLRESELLLRYINYEWLGDLSAVPDYRKNKKYVHLKRQLTDLVKHNPIYEILYFAAQDEQGTPYMYINNFSDDAPESLLKESHGGTNITDNNVFETKGSFVSKTLDGWKNKDISVFVSLNQEMYGNLNFVFGADIDIGDWLMNIFMDISVFISIIILIFLICGYLFFPYQILSSGDTFITRKIAPYLFMIILFVLFVFVLSLFKQQSYFIDKMVEEKIGTVPFHFDFILKKEELTMKTILDGIEAFPEIKAFLQDSQREVLRARYERLYDVLYKDGAVSHFSFYSAKGINILRLHNDTFGDFDNKYLLQKAKETKSTATGIEIEKNGEIVLWAIKPVYMDEFLLGFIEVGNRIENIMKTLDIEMDASMTFFIKKQFIDKDTFEKNRGGIVDWEGFGNNILVYSSYSNISFLEDNIKDLIGSNGSSYFSSNNKAREFSDKDHLWYINVFPFFDFSGQHVGDILAIYDYTETNLVFSRIIKIGGAFLLVLIVFGFFVLYVIFRNTDRNILRQKGEILDKESYLSFMVESLDSGVIITDNHQNILMMNPAAKKIIFSIPNLKPDASVKEVFARFKDKDGSDLKNPVKRAIKTNKKIASAGVMFVDNEGAERVLDYTVKPVLGMGNELIGVVLVISDRTSQYTNLVRGDHFSEKLQLAIGSSGIGVWEYDFDTGAMYWDKNMRLIYGVSEGLVVDVSMWTDVFLHPQDKEKVSKAWKEAVSGSKKMDFETRIVLATGEIKHIRVTAIPLGRDSRYVGVNFDITEQKIFQNKIQQSEKALSLLVDNIDSAIFEGELVFDSEGIALDYVFRKINKAFEQLADVSEEIVVGKLASHVLPELQDKDFIKYCSKVVKEESSVRFDKFSQKFNMWLSVHIYKTEGNFFAVLLDNISARKRTEEKLKSIIAQDKKQAEQFHKSQLIALSIMEDANSARKEAETLRVKAEKAYKAKSQFLANMSHEIRTPMNAILGYGDLLRKTYLNNEQSEYLRMICSSGELLVGIIDDILDVSKFEAGRIVLESIEFDINYLCCNVFKLILPQIKDKQIETYIDFDKDVPAYWKGDPTRLRQVLINLLANAVKFTYKGKIGLEVRSKGKDATGKYNVLEFIVSDTGIGISRSKQKSIFEAFDQANQSITREFGGTGLGLAICKAVVAAMGGEIHVTSVKGRGSKFVFTINLESVDKKVLPEKIEPVREEELKGKKVLIVDSLEQSRELLVKCCQERAMDVLAAYNDAKTFKHDLIRLAEENVFPDLLIIDGILSDDSGLNVIRDVRGDLVLENVKIVTVTSDVRAGTAKVSFEAGCHGYLAKPFTEEDFVKVLTFVFGIKGELPEIITRHVGGEEEESVKKDLSVEKIKIILAEDNVVNQKLMREYFKVLGIEFDIVSNGEEVVKKIGAGAYDLCFMDIQMPVMDGLKATGLIRETISKDIPIIGISANVMEEHKKTALDEGMNDYLKKPVNIGTIRQVLEKWCK